MCSAARFAFSYLLLLVLGISLPLHILKARAFAIQVIASKFWRDFQALKYPDIEDMTRGRDYNSLSIMSFVLLSM
jgi:hypothetical protein